MIAFQCQETCDSHLTGTVFWKTKAICFPYFYSLSQTSAIGAVGMDYRSGWIFGLTHYYFLHSYVKYFEPKNEKYSHKETAVY